MARGVVKKKLANARVPPPKRKPRLKLRRRLLRPIRALIVSAIDDRYEVSRPGRLNGDNDIFDQAEAFLDGREED